ncbi:hypothetical protein RLPCCGM1_p0648 [Rhizobium leguminosarum bv. phaseoli CCGM1]|nr:hypothetical protein [Rhizobium phaseoli]KEC70874.1 hypothetical protein RLPCCGM1_p0648 [Rhizobium leguminosarum bv. phaseoli CCGM1]
MRRLTALKFYGLAYAARSVVTTGLEAVDDFLVIMAQPGGARKTMEQHVLPVVAESQLTDMILPTRSMYAIVLAWCGEFGMARRELAALREYAMDGPQSEMLETRAEHVEAVIGRWNGKCRRRDPWQRYWGEGPPDSENWAETKSASVDPA